MLQTLLIKNVAIVENVRVDLTPGLNVITGETGAGKSILVGALGLVLGERADRTMIRAGEESCSVEATFTLADASEVDSLLEDLGLPSCEDGRLIVRRIVSSAGGTRNWLNDSSTTLQALKAIGNLLVDMHGPHDHQSLLNPAFQVDLLDSFGHLWKRRAVYEKHYDELKRLEAQRAELDSDDENVAAQLDLLSFQVGEIESAELSDADDADLEQEHAQVANAQRILALCDTAQRALTEDDASAFAAMTSVLRSMEELAGLIAAARPWREEAESVSIQVRELAASLSSYAQDVEADPGRLQWLEDRMALLHKLKRKYGATVPEILSFQARAKERLEALASRGERIREVESRMAEVRGSMEVAGLALRKDRAQTAAALAEAITDELRGLGFAHGAFFVDVSPCPPAAAGMDQVEFGFAPNVGEPMRALRAIASSGEISRVMLAVKAVLATHDRIPLLVFDEIDANVGGEMGNAVGAKLEAVSAFHQVLCITHLAQVAVHGVTHFLVDKHVEDGRTHTSIRRIENDARVEEVARMLGGKDRTLSLIHI